MSTYPNSIAAKDARIAELEAEVERLKLSCSAWEDSARINKARADDAEALSRTGAVKVLEWRHYPDAFPPMWVAAAAFGNYSIEEASGSDSPTYDVFHPTMGRMANVDGLPEAKSAAQADYERRILSALTHPAPTREDESGEAVCDVLTIGHSSGFPDHFTRIRVGDRSLTMFMSKIKGRCEYHAAELNWLLNDAKKPNIMDFDDTEPDGLAEYLSHTSGERLTPEQVADHIGVTPHSDMRPFVVQAVRYAREQEALSHTSGEVTEAARAIANQNYDGMDAAVFLAEVAPLITKLRATLRGEAS